jgi:TonB family protein
MRKAIVISLVLHMMALGLVFRHSVEKQKGYPPVMIAHLASPPPLLGVKNPPAPKAVETSVTKPKPTPPKPPPKDARTTEINPKKKPKIVKKPKEEVRPAKEETPQQPSTQEQKNRGLPDGVELGSEFGFASLDAAGFDSPYYLDILFGKIRREWENPYEGMDKITCTIYFAVGRDGKILDSAIEKSSGIPAYDQAALRAVLAVKAPPLPNQFGSDELGIHLGFQYIPNQ